MTASPPSPTGTRAHPHARRPWHGCRILTAVIVQALILLAPGFGGRAQAETRVKGEVKVTTDGGFARLAFRFEKEMPATVNLNYPIIVVTFKAPVTIALDPLSGGAADYISAARLDPDGTSIRIALKHQVKLNVSPIAEQLYVDLLPANWSGIMPGLPSDVVLELANRALEAERQLRLQRATPKEKKTQEFRVKVATQPTFIRYVFAMPDLANVVPENADGKLTLDFDQAIKWDLADAKAGLPATLQSIDSDIADNSTTVTFAFKGAPQVRTFREDRSIVVDVDREGSKPKQVAGEGVKPPQAIAAAPAGPAIEPPETVPAKDAAAESAAGQAATNPAGEAVQKAAEAAEPKDDTKPAIAETKSPPPNPDAPVVVTLRQPGDLLLAEFPFAVATPAAVFSRADTVWLVFDSTAKIDIGALANDPTHAIRSAVLEHGADGEAIVRLKLERPRLVSLEADGPSWNVTVADTVTTASRPLIIARNIVSKGRASITVPFEKPSKLHWLTDHGGDRLMVITSLGPARGFLKGQNFVELRALPSTHGVVLQPLADDLTAELSVDKIVIDRPGGLSLSSSTIGQDRRLDSSTGALSFDTQLWGFDRQAKFGTREAELIQSAAMAPPTKRKQARFNLARFYLAREMASEAKAVLDVALSDKTSADDVTGTVLRAVAEVMLDRPADALKHLSNPRVGNQLDAPIWRAIAYARERKWSQAYAAFKDVDNAVAALPLELQRFALRNAMRSAIEVRDFNGADRLLNEIESLGVPPEMAPGMAVLTGRLKQALGHNYDALASYRAAADFERPARRRARPIARDRAPAEEWRHASPGRDQRARIAHHDLARRRDRSGRISATRASLQAG